jgi:hypothetical protein
MGEGETSSETVEVEIGPKHCPESQVDNSDGISLLSSCCPLMKFSPMKTAKTTEPLSRVVCGFMRRRNCSSG